MDEEIRKYLEAADDPIGILFPGNEPARFPLETYQGEVAAIQERLRQELGLQTDMDNEVKGAAFFAELMFCSPEANPPRRDLVRINIQFSNFGKLATIWTSNEASSNIFPLSKIESILKDQGWIPIPMQALDEAYNGANAEFYKRGGSWYARFFEYSGY
ncbi:MAG: hypothetical protein ACREJ2_14765 [Planctomycetota bacterium]